jgi:hypothetical protein
MAQAINMRMVQPPDLSRIDHIAAAAIWGCYPKATARLKSTIMQEWLRGRLSGEQLAPDDIVALRAVQAQKIDAK